MKKQENSEIKQQSAEAVVEVDWRQLEREMKAKKEAEQQEKLTQERIKLWLDKEEIYNRADRRKMGLRNYTFHRQFYDPKHNKYSQRRTIAGMQYEFQKQALAELFAQQNKVLEQKNKQEQKQGAEQNG